MYFKVGPHRLLRNCQSYHKMKRTVIKYGNKHADAWKFILTLKYTWQMDSRRHRNPYDAPLYGA
jgi:hypothetical protein